MNKQLSEAIARVTSLPEDQQQKAAAILFDFLDGGQVVELTPEQIAEIERRLTEDDVATVEEVKDFFDRTKK
jgi:hypothetical protein